MTPEQVRFLALHAAPDDMPTEWRWYFRESTLRVRTVRGKSAAIRRDEFDDLVAAGLMARGAGCADARVTKAGARAAR
jgi:hypothetical protein